MSRLVFLVAACSAAAACSRGASSSAPTAADAKAFLGTVNETTMKLGIEASRAGWVQQTYITDDTEALAARANQAANDAGARLAKEATRYDHGEAAPGERREPPVVEPARSPAAP